MSPHPHGTNGNAGEWAQRHLSRSRNGVGGAARRPLALRSFADEGRTLGSGFRVSLPGLGRRRESKKKEKEQLPLIRNNPAEVFLLVSSSDVQ
ncbi:unnamed protein product [Pleuronectes platessa]|uniref:Uncharacterized protein n=1 Tax=Pleuronectes platessa TaxID=8262 RepID=A0A9N7VBA3_PLEPL|nr:unnamed protein product [Pleuronectes platessa]